VEETMPLNISSVGPLSLPQEQPAPISSQSSGPASPTPQDSQANINQGVQEAAQNLDEILKGALGGEAATQGPKTNVTSATLLDTTLNKVLELKHEALKGIAQNIRG